MRSISRWLGLRMGWSRAAQLALVSMSALLLIAGPQVALADEAAPSIISFLDTQPIAIKDATSPPRVSVLIVNLSEMQQTVTIWRSDPNGTADPVQASATPKAIPAGGVESFEVDLPVPYDGTLIATSDHGGYATRDVSVAARSVVAQPMSGVIAPPYPSKVTMSVDTWLPSPLVSLVESRLFDVKTWGLQWSHLVVADAAKQAFDGAAVSGPNSIARLYVGPDNSLGTIGTDRAGAYTGTVKIGSGDAASSIDVTVNVRDFFVYPLLVLLLSLFLASKLDAFLSKRRPRARLQIEIERLKERARSEQKKFGDWLNGSPLPPWPVEGTDRHAILIYDGADAPSALLAAGTEGLSKFDQIESPDERDKRFGVPMGTDVAMMRDLVDHEGLLLEDAQLVSKDYGELLRLLPKDQAPTAIPIVAHVRDAWSGPQPKTVAEFDAGLKSVEESAKDLKRLAQVLAYANEVLADAEEAGDKFPARAKALLDRLFGPATQNSDDADGVMKELRDLEGEIAKAGSSRRTASLDAAVVEQVFGDQAWMGIRNRRLARRPRASSESLSKELNALEWRYGLIGGAAVVLTGATVYLSNATFGSLGDYVGLLLWGIGVGEAIKLARRLPIGDLAAKLA